ncbi:MAG: SAM-dependent methyltransferase [Rhodospirillaceae bacterium]
MSTSPPPPLADATTETGCTDHLIERIKRNGPISIAAFMETVVDTYYARGNIFGRSGDFVTAPEISQVFGELIGLWCITAWQCLDQPRDFHLVECGPGRGTLMADIIRTTSKAAPRFGYAVSVHLIERSEKLRAEQEKTLMGHNVSWHEDLSTLPEGPVILVANEFLDALPITQYVKTSSGWCERLVNHNGREFVFTVAGLPTPNIDDAFHDAPEGSILEHSTAVHNVVSDISKLCIERPGIGLLIDYGYVRTDIGDTLQAVKDHAYAPVLKAPGFSDLTAHVDFALVSEAARSVGSAVYGPVEQGLWLKRLGIKVREAQLSDGKSKQDVETIRASIARLIDPEAMGSLFKVLAIAPSHIAPLAGFEAKVK